MLRVKKAVSALIATVLLVSFSLALGAIVLNVTREQTHDIKETAEAYIERNIKCNEVILKVLEMNNEKFLCYNRSNQRNLEVVLINQGKTTIKGIKAIILDLDENLYTKVLINDLGAYNISKFNISLKESDINYNFTFPPKKIIIYPILDVKNDAIDLCDPPRIEEEEIKKCT